MGDSQNMPARPRRLRSVLVLVTTLLVGLVLGVVADRIYLGVAQHSPDPRLVGDWVADDGGIVRFRADGTYESANVTAVNGKVTEEKPYTSQYRWVDRGTIQVYEPLVSQWVSRQLAFEGDQLTMLGDQGVVVRFTRKRD